jgi:hypothetical protein
MERDNKRPLTDRENKFNNKTLGDTRNHSVRNLQSARFIKKPEISLSTKNIQRPASTDRFKPTYPNTEPQITAMYNVKMNFNINKDIFNNNYINNLGSKVNFQPHTTKADKLSLTKKLYETKTKEKYIKLEKPAQTQNRFYQSSPDKFNIRPTVRDSSIKRNSSQSRIGGLEGSLNRNGSESKMFTMSYNRGNPSPGRFLQHTDSRSNLMKPSNEPLFNTVNIEKLWSKKSNIKKKLPS